jgi:hypothetical protein
MELAIYRKFYNKCKELKEILINLTQRNDKLKITTFTYHWNVRYFILCMFFVIKTKLMTERYTKQNT